MGEEHRINEIKGVIISRALLKEYGYDGLFAILYIPIPRKI